MSDNPIIYTKDNYPSNPKEFMIDIFGENMNMWPTLDELLESAQRTDSPLSNSRTAAPKWEPGDILLSYWDAMEEELSNYWLIYVGGPRVAVKGKFFVSFPYPNSWTYDMVYPKFWYSFEEFGTGWYSDKFYGMVNIDELKALDKFSIFTNWAINPFEVKQ